MGRDRPRADPAARWRTRLWLVGLAVGSQRCGAAERWVPGTLGLGRPEDRSPLVGTLDVRARDAWWAVVDEGRARPFKLTLTAREPPTIRGADGA